MTDEENMRVLQLIFSEIRADHTVDGLTIEFRPRPVWEPYVEAVLARQRQGLDALTAVTTSERKTGLRVPKRTFGPMLNRPGAWLWSVRPPSPTDAA